MTPSYFANRTIVLATMHCKEQVIAPILERELGVKVVVPESFNTDIFGTFTRERDRPGNQLETARIKAQNALDLTGETLAIASEGSFVPHPSLPSIPSNRELVVLIDRIHNLEITGEELSLNTNFNHKIVKTFEEAQEFAQKIGFPQHGLIVSLSSSTRDSSTIVKGITTEAHFLTAVKTALERSPNGTIHLETDMRALYNPTRMQVIQQATQNLVKAVNQTCPECGCPGMKVIERRRGLLCELCNLPTNLTRSLVYGCQKCQVRREVLFPDGMTTADPTYCGYCNP
ncbi:DUF6671 family protein [Pantanalinema sp. GBBB05]|uniref:DUF6671 family protein n=1 Tax=Pantanalinema sp. GBBB05 TaxID=2604139 RepID=UPI001D7A48C3|nr:hypothetical protein [Pantanalinema sp. GBBB05]